MLITLSNLANAVTVTELTYLAKKYDDPVTQYLLARYYLKSDTSEAAKWFKQAAENGHLLSKYELGMLYYKGDGVKQNFKKAVKFLKIPASKGKEKALFLLGVMYDQGLGVDKNSNKAFEYFGLGADNYYPLSLYKVAMCYFYGRGVTKNYKKSKKWAELAIQYNVDGAKKLLQLIDKAQGIKKAQRAADKISTSAKNMLLDIDEKKQKAKRDKAVRKLTSKDLILKKMLLAADDGDRNSQFKLAQAYQIGALGIKVNMTQAISWYNKAADNGHLKSQFLLGKMYLEGRTIAKNDHFGKKWLKLAAGHGSNEAKILLTKLVNNPAQKESSAINILLKLAKTGDMEAQYVLAEHYYFGQILKKDLKKSAQWCKKAAKQGHVEAQYQMGIMHSEGKGIRKSIASSRKWLRLAAKQGHLGAQRYLSGCDKDDGRVFHGVNNPC